ncbi:MAG: hypothetical protein HRU19_02700 [Pseudobacteriovorax sp.]|nr:hypothetical protein [Pseudobacteriovorax sp.]
MNIKNFYMLLGLAISTNSLAMDYESTIIGAYEVFYPSNIAVSFEKRGDEFPAPACEQVKESIEALESGLSICSRRWNNFVCPNVVNQMHEIIYGVTTENLSSVSDDSFNIFGADITSFSIPDAVKNQILGSYQGDKIPVFGESSWQIPNEINYSLELGEESLTSFVKRFDIVDEPLGGRTLETDSLGFILVGKDLNCDFLQANAAVQIEGSMKISYKKPLPADLVDTLWQGYESVRTLKFDDTISDRQKAVLIGYTLASAIAPESKIGVLDFYQIITDDTGKLKTIENKEGLSSLLPVEKADFEIKQTIEGKGK